MKYRKMSESDVGRVLQFLSSVTADAKLTWRDVEEFSGFTRQALQARDDIKGAYDVAKKIVRQGKDYRSPGQEIPLPVNTDQALRDELLALRERVKQLENQEALWNRRWYRIAYNIRQQGIQMVAVDKVIPLESKGMTSRQVDNLLRPFEGVIPPVASRRED
jgi:hypothetical protein